MSETRSALEELVYNVRGSIYTPSDFRDSLMSKSRLQIARSDIIKYFDGLAQKVHRQTEIGHHLAKQRDFWRLTQRTTTLLFIKFLTDSAKLSKVLFPFPPPYKREIRYVWGEVPMYEVMLTLKRDCYFSHYTAVKLHGLTEQSPKTTYVNDEQRLKSVLSGKLTQESIDKAFRRPVRISNNVAETADFRVCLVNGKNTGKLGVIEEQGTDPEGKPLGKLRLTNIERTLIDIVVRPAYSGGPTEVLKAYKLAQDKASVNRLTAMLKKLEYIYPYHQAIGFYLERSGYKPAVLDLLSELPMEFDFYLMHNMKEMEYKKEWRLFVPKGL
jgi:hypothetical protein